MTLPTRSEYYRARSTPRAYVVVDARGLRWELRPAYTPPRPAEPRWELRPVYAPPRPAELLTVRRFDSTVVAERMLAEAVADVRAEWREWVRRG